MDPNREIGMKKRNICSVLVRCVGNYVNGDTEATLKKGKKTLLFGQFLSGFCLWKGDTGLMRCQ